MAGRLARRFFALAIAWAALGTSTAAAVTITPVASGLDNPRGMSFGPNGALYVAESGRGGTDFCFDHPAIGPVCQGPSGAVTRIWKGTQERLLTGLPSIGSTLFGEALGPSDVSAHGNGNLYVTLGLGADPAIKSAFPASAQLHGWLIKGNPSGNWMPVADIGAFEAANDPDADQGGHVDTNPNAVVALPGGQAVVDAGANDVVWVDANRRISLLAVLPFAGAIQPVPTSIAAGPDGALYVGQLTGFPFLFGTAAVFRIVPGQAPTVYADGFTNIIDVAFGADGSLYVLEISHFGLLSGDPRGGLWRVPAGGRRSCSRRISSCPAEWRWRTTARSTPASAPCASAEAASSGSRSSEQQAGGRPAASSPTRAPRRPSSRAARGAR